jgi:hypothetical protein
MIDRLLPMLRMFITLVSSSPAVVATQLTLFPANTVSFQDVPTEPLTIFYRMRRSSAFSSKVKMILKA